MSKMRGTFLGSSPTQDFWSQLPVEAQMKLRRMVRPRTTRYIPHSPRPKQAVFLLLNHREALYGGAAGGGKSDALLMGGLQYVDVPGYSALLLRRTSPQLVKAEGLISRSLEWLYKTDAKWNEKRMTWTFPSSATLEFGHMQYEQDKQNYQGANYYYIGIDELTHFSKSQYVYMLSRQRRCTDLSNRLSAVPLRLRGGANPGGVGHEWVFNRFVRPAMEGDRTRPFVPATLADNPYINKEEYMANLMELDPITREQLLNGNWSAKHEGSMFDRGWFGPVLDVRPARFRRMVRFWDLAHSKPTPDTDPDWTVGMLYGEDEVGQYHILNVARFRDSAAGVERRIAQVAERDSRSVPIEMEQEPAGGKSIVDRYGREILRGFVFNGRRPISRDPAIRWGPVSSASERGLVSVMSGGWNEAFFDEIEVAPYGDHDDQLTAWAGAHRALTERGSEPDVY